MQRVLEVPLPSLIVAAVLLVGFGFVAWLWVKEISHFRSVGWNFEADNPDAGLGSGVEGGEPEAGNNKIRMFVFYPMVLFILLLMVIGFVSLKFSFIAG